MNTERLLANKNLWLPIVLYVSTTMFDSFAQRTHVSAMQYGLTISCHVEALAFHLEIEGKTNLPEKFVLRHSVFDTSYSQSQPLMPIKPALLQIDCVYPHEDVS